MYAHVGILLPHRQKELREGGGYCQLQQVQQEQEQTRERGQEGTGEKDGEVSAAGSVRKQASKQFVLHVKSLRHAVCVWECVCRVLRLRLPASRVADMQP